MIVGAAQMLLQNPVAASGHRYWRILATAATHNSGFGGYVVTYAQVSMFASADGSGTDLCLGKTASAKTEYSVAYAAAMANDNNTGTWWNSAVESAYQWWKIDLGAGGEAAIHSVQLLSPSIYSPVYLPQSCALQYSDDNTNWTTQSSFNTANSTSLQTFTNL